MASDLLVGFILGVVIVGFLLPMKGVLFIILEQRKQIAFLSGQKEEVPVEANRHDDR
jgi:hypothetical protein